MLKSIMLLSACAVSGIAAGADGFRFTPSDDTMVYSGVHNVSGHQGNYNYGRNAGLYVGNNGTNLSRYRVLLRFDLAGAGIAADSITGAELLFNVSDISKVNASGNGVPIGVYMSVMRTMPTLPESSRRNVEVEGMSRMDALRGMTTNVAYMWHAEDRMGSLSIGKLANMAVFDKDFLVDDIEDIAWARCLATIVDGEQVYEIGSDGPVGPTIEEMVSADE